MAVGVAVAVGMGVGVGMAAPEPTASLLTWKLIGSVTLAVLEAENGGVKT